MFTRLDSLVRADSLLVTTQLGLMVWDLTDDREVYAWNSQQLMRPASTMKVLTAVTALDRLGGDYELRTSIYIRGEVKGGVLTGDLVCVGGMDPMCGREDLRAIVGELKRQGVKTLRGNIVTDNSMKESEKWGEGWCWDDKNPTLAPLLSGGKADFGFEVGGRRFNSLECAYICGVYSGTAPEGASAEERAAFERTCAEIQERIRGETNALYAKKRWREGKAGHGWTQAYQRPDWKDGSWHYEWMLYLWTLKIRQVPAFRATIRRIARTWAVVEESPHGPTKPLADPANDELVRKCDGDGWGCVRVRRPDGSLSWRGRNHFGVIAMECAAALREHRGPDVDVAELRRRRIRLFGEELRIEDPEPFPKDGSWDETDRREHARRAGSRTSERKKAASATNGRLGGRPRKVPGKRTAAMPSDDS